MGSDRNHGGSHSDGGGSFRTTWNPERPDSLTNAVVTAVAEARGIDRMEVPEPLGDVLDADALVRVLVSGSGSETVTVDFTLGGQAVTVDSDGAVVVEARGGS